MKIGIFAKRFVRPTLAETLEAVAQHGIHAVQFNLASWAAMYDTQGGHNDLRGDATLEGIRAAVREMKLSALNRRLTLWAFTSFLLKNAYTRAQMQALVAQTAFAGCDIREDRIGMQVWLEK